MRDLDEELWKLGVFARTEHNEVAARAARAGAGVHQRQRCFRPEPADDGADAEGRAAARAACLLHEKPFAGVNGSGKHNNWSLATDTGENLLNPGPNPASNVRFLLFLAAVIRAVDEHQDLLRASVASAGNDHRLGGNEAPAGHRVDVRRRRYRAHTRRHRQQGRLQPRRRRLHGRRRERDSEIPPLYVYLLHIAVRVYGQQVRVPDAGLVVLHRPSRTSCSTRSWPTRWRTSPTSWSARRASTTPRCA